MSAATYTLGDRNSNDCPPHFERIETRLDCENAAIAYEQRYVGGEDGEDDSTFPGGCYSVPLTDGSSGVFFNHAKPGAGEATSSLLCSLFKV